MRINGSRSKEVPEQDYPNLSDLKVKIGDVSVVERMMLDSFSEFYILDDDDKKRPPHMQTYIMGMQFKALNEIARQLSLLSENTNRIATDLERYNANHD